MIFTLGNGFGGNGSAANSGGSKSISPETPPIFYCPRRPNIGREGKQILLRANHVQINMPRGFIHHYHISIVPDKCPRKVNREIIETMVHSYGRIFTTKKPVFDGRSNLYVRDPLPIGLYCLLFLIFLLVKSQKQNYSFSIFHYSNDKTELRYENKTAKYAHLFGKQQF